MTTTQKRAAGIALVTAIVGALAAPLLAMAWNAKVSTSDYRLDLQRIEADHDKDVRRLEARDSTVYTLLLDMRCDQKPSDRRCK